MSRALTQAPSLLSARTSFKLSFFDYLQDINRVEASIGKFAKQIDAFQIDKIRWLKRFQDGKMELAQTRKQITDEVMSA